MEHRDFHFLLHCSAFHRVPTNAATIDHCKDTCCLVANGGDSGEGSCDLLEEKEDKVESDEEDPMEESLDGKEDVIEEDNDGEGGMEDDRHDGE